MYIQCKINIIIHVTPLPPLRSVQSKQLLCYWWTFTRVVWLTWLFECLWHWFFGYYNFFNHVMKVCCKRKLPFISTCYESFNCMFITNRMLNKNPYQRQRKVGTEKPTILCQNLGQAAEAYKLCRSSLL